MGLIKKLKNYYSFLFRNQNFNSSIYWEKRYVNGGNSGVGSYGDLAMYKASFINNFVKSNNIKNVIEFGCGDGNQLTLSEYPNYLGLDVSSHAIKKCASLFAIDHTKRFYSYNPHEFNALDSFFKSELSLSLDVTYHLIEYDIYELYLHHLFDTSERYVIIYSIDADVDPKETARHVRYRKFTNWIEKNKTDWEKINFNNNNINRPDGTCDFFVYKRRN